MNETREWATRVQYTAGAPTVTPVRDEEAARFAYRLMRTMPFPYTVEGGRVAAGIELVSRASDGEWQVTQ